MRWSTSRLLHDLQSRLNRLRTDVVNALPTSWLPPPSQKHLHTKVCHCHGGEWLSSSAFPLTASLTTLLVMNVQSHSYVFTSMVEHLSSSVSIHSLRDNSIGAEGAVAISEAMKTMTNLHQLE